jgi:hypothetical protein
MDKNTEEKYELCRVGHLTVGDYFIYGDHQYKIVWHQQELYACVVKHESGELRLAEFHSQKQVFSLIKTEADVQNI